MAAASLGAEARSTSPRTVITGGSVTSEMLYPNAAGSFILLLCDEPRGPVGPGVCRPPREIASEPHGRGARLPGRAPRSGRSRSGTGAPPSRSGLWARPVLRNRSAESTLLKTHLGASTRQVTE